MSTLSDLDYDLITRRLHNDPEQACPPGCGDCGAEALYVEEDDPKCGWCGHRLSAHTGKPYHVGGVVVGDSTCAQMQAANPGKTGCPDCRGVRHGRRGCDSDFPDAHVPTGHRYPAIRFRAPGADSRPVEA